MRSATVLVAMLVLVAAVPSVPAQPEEDVAAAARESFLALKLAALAGRGEPESATARAESDVFARSIVDARDAVEAWRAVEASETGVVRERVLEAEAQLVAVAAANALVLHERGETQAARAWLQVVLDRVDWRARGLDAPLGTSGDAMQREALVETLHGALAVRAREEAVQAMMLARAGLVEEARASGSGAEAFAAALVPDAARRLPSELAAPLVENATRVREALDDLPEERKEHALTGFVAPLVALEFNRDVEPLDEKAARNADAAFVAARAAAADPALRDVLVEQAVLQYAADRAFLFIKGEGQLDELDAAYERFRSADPSSLHEAARGVREALRPLALMERGIVLKVEVGGIQPGRVHEYAYWLVRPPIEGISSYQLRLTFDPGVVEVLDVVPSVLDDEFTIDLGADSVIFSAESTSEPLRRSAQAGKLLLRATGPPEASSNLTIEEARFVEVDGGEADVFRLRHGAVTVAALPSHDAPREEDPSAEAFDAAAVRETPSPAPLLGVLAALLLTRRRRP